jgi:7-cyano-7-deazaguanine synthase
MMKPAVILVSGGLDSATVLAMAQSQGYECHALSFDYGQKHNAELVAAQRVVEALKPTSHRVMKIHLDAFGGSALTDDAIDVPEEVSEGIPNTYVPARNTIFLSFALGLAEVVGAHDIFIGVNAVDYSGYPDCRPAFIDAYEKLANLATKEGVEGRPFKIHAPLIQMSKAEIIKTGIQLGVDYAVTVTCYQANQRGEACGRCDACRLRQQGFIDAGVSDPTVYCESSGANNV